MVILVMRKMLERGLERGQRFALMQREQRERQQQHEMRGRALHH